jgi:type I restriction enzyme, S subunit
MSQWPRVALTTLAVAAGKPARGEVHLPVYSVTKHHGFVPSLEYFKKQVFSRDLSSYTVVEPGEFAYATIHLDEGSLGISPERCLISPMYTAFRLINDQVEPRYLLRYLKSPVALSKYATLGRGSAERRRSISFDRLGTVEVPLPALAEQRRIAEVLDRAEALRAKRRAALVQLDTLTKALFREKFGDPTANRYGWRVAKLGDVARTTSGGTPARGVAEYFGGSIPWVKSGELHQEVVTSTEEALTEQGVAESSAKVMPAGTVLVAMYGATAGAVATLGIDAATNQAVCCIQPNREVEPIYLVYLLRHLTPSLLAKRVGGAQPNLSQELLRNMHIVIPPHPIQGEFARQVGAADRLKAAQRASLAEMDALFASLQHRAFRGEL